MKNKLFKTQHFIERSWERGYHQFDIDKLIKKMQPSKKKHFYLINKKVLAKMGIKKTKAKYLVIVIKNCVLLTLFEVDNLYCFLKSHTNVNFTAIQ